MTEAHVHLTGVKTLLGQTSPLKMIPTPLWCFGWLRAWLWFCSLVLRSSPLLCLSCAIKHLASTITQQRIHTNVQPCICTSKPQRFPKSPKVLTAAEELPGGWKRSESEAGRGEYRGYSLPGLDGVIKKRGGGKREKTKQWMMRAV